MGLLSAKQQQEILLPFGKSLIQRQKFLAKSKAKEQLWVRVCSFDRNLGGLTLPPFLASSQGVYVEAGQLLAKFLATPRVSHMGDCTGL